MPDKFAYEYDGETYTFVSLYTTATECLERAQEEESGRFYMVMSSLVFSAFTLEAYLNHLGELKVPYWEDIDRKVSPLSKLKILCDRLSVDLNHGVRPFQTIRWLFRFRNDMAHGRTERHEGSGTTDDPNERPGSEVLSSVWKPTCTLAQAERAIEDVKGVVDKLHGATDLKDDPFLYHGRISSRMGLNKTS